MAIEVASLDSVDAVDLFLMTSVTNMYSRNSYTLHAPRGRGRYVRSARTRVADLTSEEDMAEVTLFLENLSIAPGKIHPARALQRAEAEYSLGTLDNERTSELAKSFGCQRVNKSTTAVIKAVIGMHVTAPHTRGNIPRVPTSASRTPA